MGSVIYVTAKCVRRYQSSDSLRLNILNVEYMQTVKERKIEKFTVVADSDKFTDQVVDDILSMLTDCKGDTQLFFRICDREHNSTITLRSRNTLVTVPAALVNWLFRKCYGNAVLSAYTSVAIIWSRSPGSKSMTGISGIV